MKTENFTYTIPINGTKFKVRLIQSENAKLTFEELVKRLIESEAERLKKRI